MPNVGPFSRRVSAASSALTDPGASRFLSNPSAVPEALGQRSKQGVKSGTGRLSGLPASVLGCTGFTIAELQIPAILFLQQQLGRKCNGRSRTQKRDSCRSLATAENDCSRPDAGRSREHRRMTASGRSGRSTEGETPDQLLLRFRDGLSVRKPAPRHQTVSSGNRF